MTDDRSAHIETVEFLDSISSEYDEVEKSIHNISTNGYWQAGLVLLVYVSAEEGVDEGAVKSAVDLINSSEGSAVAQWNDLLSSFEGLAPIMAITYDAREANIHVLLTDYEHPEDALGKARLYVIKGIGEIVSAEVKIFGANNAHDKGLLEYVLAHELGHALGLSHSTDPDSIMHTVLRLEDGIIQNRVGSCEASAVSALYTRSVIGNTVC